MAIDTPSTEYKAQEETWRKIRRLGRGVAEARALVETLPGMKADRAKMFRERAYYLPAFPRTVEMFVGMVFMRDPQVTGPDALEPYLEDATMTGLSFDGLASWVVSEVLETGRVAVLVDYPTVPDGLSVAQAEAEGYRATATVYETESILSAEYRASGGRRSLWRVRLAETRTSVGDDFTETQIKRVRVLELREGRYVQAVWEKVDRKSKWEVVESFTPVRNGSPLNYIPIFFLNHRDQDASPMRPPLADLADVSVSHLNSSALREWGEMWTANPTPYFAGVQAAPVSESGEGATYSLSLGSSEAILLDKEGSAGFLEFSGQGLASIDRTLDRKEKHMAALGTRILLDDPRQAVAAETARIQSAGQYSTLGKLATVASATLTAILRELALWARVSDPGAILYQLNRNFTPSGMSPDQLRAYLMAVQQGEMSSQELFATLQAADVVNPAKDYETHLGELEEDEERIATRGVTAPQLDPVDDAA
jgi:hypothetical protein